MSTDAQYQSSLLAEPGSRLMPAEIRRRLWHMLPGVLPFVMWAFPHRDPISPTLRGIILGAVITLVVGISLHWRRIARDNESTQSKVAAIAGYAVSVLLMLLLFPAHIELGLTLLAILAFGDGTATLAGKLFAKRPLPWNDEKSWAGFIGFLVMGIPAATLVYWGETHNLEAATPGVSLGLASLLAAPAVLVTGFVETLRTRLNDNIRVGVVGALVLIAMQSLLVGWP